MPMGVDGFSKIGVVNVTKASANTFLIWPAFLPLPSRMTMGILLTVLVWVATPI